MTKFKNSPEMSWKYSQYRNILTKLLRKAKDTYYIEKFILYGHDKAKTWQLVNEIANRKRKTNQNIPKVLNDENGRKIKDPQKVAELLNTHFGTVGEK